MYEKDAFKIRERALEDEFFHRVDESLREQLRESLEREQIREELAKVTALTDTELLDALIDAGFQASTLAALTLLPAIFVAWADDNVDQPERQALLSAASDHGIEPEGLAWQLIEKWITVRPKKSLWNTWQRYAEAVGASLSTTSSQKLAKEILALATVVAEASGGVLGLGKISKRERQVLDNIKQVLAG